MNPINPTRLRSVPIYIVMLVLSVSVCVGHTNAQDATPESTTVSNKSVAGLQSSAERTMDWLSQQISPPTEEASGSGFNLFSDPKTKQSAIKTGATVTLVVSLFLLFVFALKLKPNSQGRQKKGDKVLTVLGKVPFVHGQQLQLVRLGTRMLLVASSAKGSQTLSEITDPAEVLQIESAFRAGRMDLITDSLSRSEPSANGSQSNNGILLGSNQRNGRTLLEA